jgi:hypothetical protein
MQHSSKPQPRPPHPFWLNERIAAPQLTTTELALVVYPRQVFVGVDEVRLLCVEKRCIDMMRLKLGKVPNRALSLGQAGEDCYEGRILPGPALRLRPSRAPTFEYRPPQPMEASSCRCLRNLHTFG